MKHIYIAFLLLVSVCSLFSVQVSGNQSGTWSPANNPYQVVGAITVPSGQNLTIQPGVRVMITGNFQITVAGTLTAEGAEADSIRFINAQVPQTTLWPGLRFENISQPSSLSHIYLEFATTGIDCINSPITIINSRINRCQKGIELFGIAVSNPAPAIVQNCVIERSIQSGIQISENSNAFINNNVIQGNGTGTQFMAAIHIKNQTVNGSNNPIINNNHIHHNLKQGISAADVTGGTSVNPQITNNIIEYNYTGIYLYFASGYVADNQISNNFIPGDMNSGAGVMVSGASSEPYFERNTVTGNYTGFYITANARPVLGDLSIYHSWAQGENIIANNIDAVGDLHTVYCDLYPTAANIIKAENNNWGFSTAEDIAQSIRDQNDLATLPTVDFEPFITNVMPTSIIGTYAYQGLSSITDARLELISSIDGRVIQAFPLPEPDIGVTAYLEEPFYAMVVAQRLPDQASVYGCPGGFYSPTVFYPGDFTAVDIGNIVVTDAPPPNYELIGEPLVENDLTIYPQMCGFALYGWQRINWLYSAGDYLYIKKHTLRTQSGEVAFDLPLGTVWSKFQNIAAGDTWQQTEVMDSAGTLRVSTINVNACSTFLGTNTSLLYTRKDGSGLVIDKTLPALQQTMIFRYANNFVVARENVLYIGGADPLAPGTLIKYVPMPLDVTPNYLGYDPVLYNEETQSLQVKLFWQAPAYSNFSWTHYRIYRNYEQIAEIPFSQSEFIDTTFLGNETTYYEVRATDGTNTSEPSNYVVVLLVSVEDELSPPVSVSIAPNPVVFSHAQNLELKLDNLKNRSAEINIYNVKGQLVHANTLQGSQTYLWNGKDKSGNRCSSGIYFLKAQVKGENPITRKLVVY